MYVPPRPIVNEALPILSPIFIEEIVNEPASVMNNALNISVSPES